MLPPSKVPADPKAAIREKALALGFDVVGFAPATLAAEAGERLRQFVAEGRHGDMGWLAERLDERASPNGLWPEARSVVVLGLNYGPNHDPMKNLEATECGNISVYARGRDYHDILKKKLRILARWMGETFAQDVKLFVDTAPVMEKPLAQQGGLGWQGKHTNMVSREFGSWLFLGEVFTTLELAPDVAEADHCGACTRCLDVCPTKAFVAPYQLDARRCISYLTIEHKGFIDRHLRPLMGNRIYGCDDCLAVCPWNKFATPTGEAEFRKVRNDLPLLIDLLGLSDETFRLRFSGSPIKRIGRDRFTRNVLIAAGNSFILPRSATPTLAAPHPDPPPVKLGEGILPAVLRLLDDPAPVVRGMAVWALAQLSPVRFAEERSKHEASETDAEVRAEWAAM